MKRYLIVKSFIYGTYQTDEVTKHDLIDLRAGMIANIIDVHNSTMFDYEKNEWAKIGEKKQP